MSNTKTATELPILEMIAISKRFPGVKALDEASLTILPGEVHGLVGENGAGKSTIIKTLAGIYQHDEGSVRISGEQQATLTPAQVHALGIRFVHQELNLVPTFTVTESVFMGIELTGPFGVRKAEMRKRAERTFTEVLGVTIDGRTLIRDLGPAERKLVQIARALVEDNARLVVFDEPTAPLASAEVNKVLSVVGRLREQGISTLYVSHYLGEITQICDRVTVFRNGSDVGVIEEITEHTGRDLIKMMVGRDMDELFPDREARSGNVALAVSGLTDGTQFEDISFDVPQGAIIGVTGLLGSGTQELIDTIMGLRKPRAGTISIDGKKVTIKSPADALRHGMMLIPRDRRHDGLILDMDVADNINLATLEKVSRRGLLNKKASNAQAENMIGELDIRPNNPAITSRLLSGGNQQKVVLARSLAASAKIFILDEPTVGVDIGAKAEIYRLVGAVADGDAAVIVSSNDPSEILGICDQVIVMLRGRVVLNTATSNLTQDELIEHMTGSVIEEGIVA